MQYCQEKNDEIWKNLCIGSTIFIIHINQIMYCIAMPKIDQTNTILSTHYHI